MPQKIAAPKTVYVCEACGARTPRWSGQCSQCNAWNTLVETLEQPSTRSRSGGSGSSSMMYGDSGAAELVTARQVIQAHDGKVQRLVTGVHELDRVFGGGIVFGSVLLVGGEPGIGKSTIVTQMLIKVLSEKENINAIYVAGEESPQQISQRIQRMMSKDDSGLPVQQGWQERLHFFAHNDVDALLRLVEEKKPQIFIVDSIQTLITQELTGMAGSIGQLREVTARLVAVAKRFNIPTILIGHVTKDGEIAGPKVIEHIVDAVIHISGHRSEEIRMIRALKNRFGSTDEVGLFRLTSTGAEEIANPTDIFLEDKSLGKPGSALALCMEGSRPVVVEVQALVVDSYLPTPRRVSRGINVSKLHLLLAVLQKHAKVNLSQSDVYVNVVGSLELQDPAIDMAVAAALISSKKGIALGDETLYCGEIGLLGEIRKPVSLDRRLKEADRLGYKQVLHSGSMATVNKLANL